MSDLLTQLRDYGRQIESDPTVNNAPPRLVDVGTPPPRPRMGRGLAWALAAFVVVLTVGGLYIALRGGGGQVVDQTTVPTPTTVSTAGQPTTPFVPLVWPGPVRESGTLVSPMATEEDGLLTWQDPLDAAEGWVDVVRVAFYPEGQAHWYIELAAEPPLAADLEPGLLIAYGLVLETTGDGLADYLVGIDNDTPKQGDFHVWVTDLATGETDEQIGPPYGYPIEFAHPAERQPGDPPGPPTMVFTFLGDPPYGLNPETLRFYAWTSATRDGEVIAYDYAPDAGWLTGDTP